MLWLRVSIAACFVISVSSFGGSEDRFIKKYAMMKIYESCFGGEVVKQIRKEMKTACMKCAAYEAPAPSHPPTTPSRPPPMTTVPPKLDGGISDPENTIYANAQTFDMEKLNHAILAYRPNAYPVPSFRPYPSTGFYSGFPSQGSMYYPTPYQQPSPFGLPPYNLPFFGQPYYGGSSSQRTARDMDIRGQLEALTSKMSGRVRNVTCVMQELGYLDHNLEPNFSKIRERIGSLPIPEELRNDMQEGVTFCQQFSQCVPDINKDKSPLSRELIRPMFFFKCYKHKKLEACIMKDVREKYTGVADEDFDGAEMELRRTSKAAKLEDKEVDDLASSMYDFLYGTDSNVDLDTFF